MKSGSWSSYVAAGALGDGDGPDDEPAPPIGGIPPDDTDQLYEAGYRAIRHDDGSWVVCLPTDIIGAGSTAFEAWEAARRWLADRMAADRDEATRGVDDEG